MEKQTSEEKRILDTDGRAGQPGSDAGCAGTICGRSVEYHQAYGTGIWKICRRKRRKPDRKCSRSGSDGADRDGDGRDCARNRKGDKAGHDPGDRCAGGKKQ